MHTAIRCTEELVWEKRRAVLLKITILKRTSTSWTGLSITEMFLLLLFFPLSLSFLLLPGGSPSPSIGPTPVPAPGPASFPPGTLFWFLPCSKW